MSDVNGDPHAFRAAAGRFASGVTVVTTRCGAEVYGITVSAFASLSLNPLLVTVSINSASPILALVRESGTFAVSVLERSQEAVSRFFATPARPRGAREFPGIVTVPMVTGAPVVAQCLSYFDCQLHSVLPGGDHKILVGQVVASGGREGEPLLYYGGGYHALQHGAQSLERVADALAVQMHLLGISARELLDAQAAIEPAVAELAAGQATAERLRDLREHLAEARGALHDPDRFTEHSVRFHMAVGEMSGNRPLLAALLALRRVQQVHYARNTTAERARRTLDAHHRILDALAASDPAAARSAMTDHVHMVSAGLGGAVPDA